MERIILITDRHGEETARYTASEIEEIYTPAERAALARGEAITKKLHCFVSTHVDLLAFYKARA